MNLLPLDIIHHILAYDGRIKYRNGKYVNQIAPEDSRYEILKTLPKIEYSTGFIMSSRKNNFFIYKYTSPYYSYEEPVITTITDDRARSYSFAQACICIYHVFYEEIK